MSQYKNCNCQKECQDICTKPLCGDPNLLTVFTPVVYDEVGFNLCSSVALPTYTNPTEDFFTRYPTASRFSAQIVDIQPIESSDVSIVLTKPHCYRVTLTNVLLTIVIHAYNCNEQLLTSFVVSQTYLPSDGDSDNIANPPSFTVDIYAPYGICYPTNLDTGSALPSGILNTVCFLDGKNLIHQGLNLIALPKVLASDIANNRLTIGVSFFLKSIYYAQYLIPHQGKVNVPKATPTLNDDSVCLDFVNGGLVENNVKPLELMPPKCEGRYKDCSSESCGSINIPDCPSCQKPTCNPTEQFLQSDITACPCKEEPQTTVPPNENFPFFSNKG